MVPSRVEYYQVERNNLGEYGLKRQSPATLMLAGRFLSLQVIVDVDERQKTQLPSIARVRSSPR